MVQALPRVERTLTGKIRVRLGGWFGRRVIVQVQARVRVLTPWPHPKDEDRPPLSERLEWRDAVAVDFRNDRSVDTESIDMSFGAGRR